MNRWLVASVFALSSCTSFGSSGSDTLAPLIDPPTPSAVAAPETTGTTSTTAVTVPISTTNPPVVSNFQPFPTSHPNGRCTPQAIGADFGTTPESGVNCSGAWAITRVQACPPETECEGLDVFRWTSTGWQHRGFHYSLCESTMDASGLPRWAFDELIGFSLDCDTPIRYVAESKTGPLSVGDNGPRVARLQQRLIELALLRDKADGYFGRNTNNAVIDFQFLMGLNPDGIAGPNTAAALGISYP